VGLGLLIVVLAAMLVFDLLGHVQQHRRRSRFIADLRTFAAAFERYAQQHDGGFPASTNDASLSADLENLLKATNWHKGSPFGGTYGWVASDQAGPPADASSRDHGGAITLTAFAPDFPLTLSHRDLLAVDAALDDGDPATGRFRTGFNGWPVYLVGENR